MNGGTSALALGGSSRRTAGTLLQVNAANRKGETALHLAAACGADEVVSEMVADPALDFAARASAGQHEGRTALVVARAMLRTGTARLLEQSDPVHQARREAQVRRR